MNFIWQQFKDVLKGGPAVILRKFRNLPKWLLAKRIGLGPGFFIYGVINKLAPHLSEPQILLAETLISLGRYEEAFAVWEKMFKFKPEWPDAQIRIQNAFYFNGQIKYAQIIMQKILDYRNDFARAHQLDILGIRVLTEFPTAIGHTAMLDPYVKMGMLGQRSASRPVLLVHPKIANRAYFEYLHQYLPDAITDPEAFELLAPVGKYIEDHIAAVMDADGKQIYDPYSREVAVQAQWDKEKRGPLLKLTETDEKRGRGLLRSFGVPEGAWFAAVHVRGGRDKSRSARDAGITAYRMAMESITARGGWVFRMGDPSMEPLEPMSHVIDYAHSKDRHDWMDVFLWARCRFFIGIQSGPLMVPPTFGVPCVITNWSSPATRLWFSRDLYIFKLHWSEAEKRYYTFKEVSTSALAAAESSQYLEAKKIKLVDNTPEEINDAVVEMMDRLDGKLTYTAEDDRLQEQFNRVSITNEYGANSRIGREFLRKWSQLL